MKRPVYMDYNATTPVADQVVQSMLPFFSEHFGNASSRQHRYGLFAAEAVERARRTIADVIHALPEEIIFTSGATEANNLAIRGIIDQHQSSGGHIVTSAAEHRSVLDVLQHLDQHRWRVTILPVDCEGNVHPGNLDNVITNDTVLVSLMAANNELGTISPIHILGEICTRHDVAFHTDATQYFGKLPVDVRSWPIAMMSLSAHKTYGPKGIGALYIRKHTSGAHLIPQMTGGGQERGLRAGTHNVPGIVGFGKAAELAEINADQERIRIENLRNLLEQKLSHIEGAHINGSKRYRLPNTLSIRFDGLVGHHLVAAVRNDLAISTGSACSSSDEQEARRSHVLEAIGLSEEQALSTIRISIGRFNTKEDIEFAASVIASEIVEARKRVITV